MRGKHNEELPERFDEQVTLEIDEQEDGMPTIRMQDQGVPEAWISADISALHSLSEYE